jgi:hypothetical protein
LPNQYVFLRLKNNYLELKIRFNCIFWHPIKDFSLRAET